MMWRQYHVDLWPHFPGLSSGIRDPLGFELEFPSLFRQERWSFEPKGIVKIVQE